MRQVEELLAYHSADMKALFTHMREEATSLDAKLQGVVGRVDDLLERFTAHQLLMQEKCTDMAGCIQDKVENRLSELHGVVHNQIEAAHIRIGPLESQASSHMDLIQKLEARARQLGVVTSASLATTRTAVDRIDRLDQMAKEVQTLSKIEDEALPASVHTQKNSSEGKDPAGHLPMDRPAELDFGPSESSISVLELDSVPIASSEVSQLWCLPEACVREALPCPLGCPPQVIVGSVTGSTQTAISAPPQAQVQVQGVRLPQLLSAHSVDLPTRSLLFDDVL